MNQERSINIGGIVFHAEFQAYLSLENYKNALLVHFKKYPESESIIKEIESRIAEILLSKLNEDKYLILEKDVVEMIDEIGEPESFSHINKEEPSPSTLSPNKTHKNTFGINDFSKKLYRDVNHKLIGGVAAGIARYFHIDPIWVRLLFLSPIILIDSTGELLIKILIISYSIAWISIPGKSELQIDKRTKLFYRDKENGIFAGICSGLANYFGIDVTIVRILFMVFTFLGGSGLIIYILLWLISSKAKTISQKMHSRGSKITIASIEAYLNKHVKNPELKGRIKNWSSKTTDTANHVIDEISTSKLLSSLYRITGFVGGFILFIVSAVVLLLISISVAVVNGIVNMDQMEDAQMTINEYELLSYDYEFLYTLQDTIPLPLFIAVVVCVVIPFFVSLMLGLSLMAWKSFFSKRSVKYILSTWGVSALMTSILGGIFISNFNTSASYQETVSIPLAEDQLNLEVKRVGVNPITAVKINLESHDDPFLKMEYNFRSEGRTRQDAMINAKTLNYDITFDDNMIMLPTHFQIASSFPFRKQGLELTISIPKNKPFQVSDELLEMLSKKSENEVFRLFETDDLSNQLWVFNKNNILMVCDGQKDTKHEHQQALAQVNHQHSHHNNKIISFTQVKNLEFNGNLEITLKQDPNIDKVTFNAENFSLDEFNFIQEGDHLLVNESRHTQPHQKIISVSVPSLDSLLFKGAGILNIENFHSDNSTIYLDGAVDSYINVHGDVLQLYLKGATNTSIEGEVKKLITKITGASNLNASELHANKVKVKASGLSKARVYASEEAKTFSSSTSHITILGEPSIVESHKY